MRADDMPLVLPVMGATNLPRGARVRVKLGDIDEISLDIAGTVVERLDVLDSADSLADGDGDEAEGDDEPVAGPIAIAVDMAETDTQAMDPPQLVAVSSP